MGKNVREAQRKGMGRDGNRQRGKAKVEEVRMKPAGT